MMPPRVVLFLLLGQILISSSVHASDKKTSTKLCPSTCRHKTTTPEPAEVTTEAPLEIEHVTTPETEVEIPVPEKKSCISKIAKRLTDLCIHVKDRLNFLEDMLRENNKRLEELARRKCCVRKEKTYDGVVPNVWSQGQPPVMDFHQKNLENQEEDYQQQQYPDYSYEIYDQLEPEMEEELHQNPRLKVIRPLNGAYQGPYDIHT